ncbi:MAG TPA: hypothetical protein VE863_11880 [Pyrinomonadaceae bacterium]|jgi:hypothetical protein|nr:hypothetical protein [Pyrinomonadaceae bacterium]
MGLFWKSKREKMEEESARIWARRRAEEEEGFNKLWEVFSRIERLQPNWKIEGVNGIHCTLTFDSSDGIHVYLRRGMTGAESGYRRAGSPADVGFCEVMVFKPQTETTPYVRIFKQTYCSGYNLGTGAWNEKAWKYLNEYVQRIVEPLVQQKQEQMDDAKRQEEAIKDKFWNV